MVAMFVVGERLIRSILFVDTVSLPLMASLDWREGWVGRSL